MHPFNQKSYECYCYCPIAAVAHATIQNGLPWISDGYEHSSEFYHVEFVESWEDHWKGGFVIETWKYF